ncbi:MAG: dicarboxylate/amino acid:cation symporter [Planctomycetota bacterium]
MSNEPRQTAAWPPWRWALHWQILLGLVLGAAVGVGLGDWAIGQLPGDTPDDQRGALAGQTAKDSSLYMGVDLIGDLFLNGLKLIIIPLVTSSIVLAVANLGAGKGFGRLGGKTLLYYGATSLVAILIGLTLVNVVSPGVQNDTGILVGQDLSAFSDAQSQVDAKVGGKEASDFLDTFRTMVPSNLFAAATAGNLLGLIVVSLIVGYFLARYRADAQPVLLKFVQGVYDITLRVTDLVLKIAPIGVFGLLAATVGEQYAKLVPDGRFTEFATGIGQFALTAVAALAVHFLVTMPLILMLVARVNPLRHYAAMAPALTTAFSTASSSATLPLTMDCVENRAGVSNRTASFTLPLGATVNMDGTALYECVAAVFICQAFGIELSFSQQLIIVITALLTSVGVAGVPSASLVAIAVILTGVEKGLPGGALPEGATLLAGMGLLFVFDRPLDMCRTAVNIFGDSVGAVTIARSEGEEGVLQKPPG